MAFGLFLLFQLSNYRFVVNTRNHTILTKKLWILCLRDPQLFVAFQEKCVILIVCCYVYVPMRLLTLDRFRFIRA